MNTEIKIHLKILPHPDGPHRTRSYEECKVGGDGVKLVSMLALLFKRRPELLLLIADAIRNMDNVESSGVISLKDPVQDN